jgi:hypothetical protein
MTLWAKMKFLTSELWDFLQPTVKLLASQMGQMAIPIAMATIQAYTNSDLTSAQKHDICVGAITKELTTNGMTYAMKDVNTIIETALKRATTPKE